jgi:general secretion pathway protein D
VQAVENAVNAATGEGSSQFSDLVTINADERTNSIIVAGTTGDIALIKRVVSQLDVVLAQVRIDVLIAEVTLTKNNPTGLSAFGIDYDSVTNELTLSPITAFGLGGDSDNPISITGELVGGRLIDYSYSALIEATQTNSNVNLLSAPNILTTQCDRGRRWCYADPERQLRGSRAHVGCDTDHRAE